MAGLACPTVLLVWPWYALAKGAQALGTKTDLFERMCECVVTQIRLCAWLPDMGLPGLSLVSTHVPCAGRHQC
jgi:hypothetical protein